MICLIAFDLDRDFTYIDDTISGIVAIVDSQKQEAPDPSAHKIYNVGSSSSIKIRKIVNMIEFILRTPAKLRLLSMQDGDVFSASADITAINEDYGYNPKAPINAGLNSFAKWFRSNWRTKSDDPRLPAR